MKDIFKWFTLDDGTATVVRIQWFVDQFSIREFSGIDRMLYLYLEYCANLGIPAYKKYLEKFLRTECKKLVKKHNIKLATMENYNYEEPGSLEEAVRVISSTCIQTYSAYCNIDITENLFKVDMLAFISEGKREAIRQCMADAFPKLSLGGDVQEIAEELQNRLDEIQDVYDEDYLDELDFLLNENSSLTSKDNLEFICKTGLPCVDGDNGGAYTKQVVAVTGPPGSGKTRLVDIHYAYQAAVKYKHDVLIDELELSKGEVQNILIAYHIVQLYGGKIKIPDSLMNKRDIDGNLEMSPEMQRYYEAARIDLFESGKYGKINIRTDDLNVCGLRKRMFTYLRNNKKCKLWIIDYAGLAEYHSSEKYSGHKEEYEIIQELYKTAKKIAKFCNIGVVIVNQFTKEGNQANDMGKAIIPGHIQGGQIIERHADYDFVMTMTPEQKIAKMRMLSTVKVRAATGFSNVPYSTDLSVSIFRQLNKSALN